MKKNKESRIKNRESVNREAEAPQCKLTPETADITRRNFLKLGMSGLGMLAALEVGGASLIYLRSHSLQGVFGSVITAGRADAFPNGSVTEFPDARFFLVRADDGGYMAVHTRCPHLGCTVVWVEEKQEFLCPCHASTFDKHGDHGGPPVSRALDMFPVRIKDGLVLVDTTEKTQREAFSPDQLTYA